jgi:hypothetical protein
MWHAHPAEEEEVAQIQTHFGSETNFDSRQADMKGVLSSPPFMKSDWNYYFRIYK